MRSLVTIFVFFALVFTAGQAYPTAAAGRQEQGEPAGNSYVDVTIEDRFGSPLAGVKVRLTGVVIREAISNDVGFVTFDALPKGRYDVVASLIGLAPSAPRLIDVPAFGGASVAVTLKPLAPTAKATLACGGYDPSTIKTLSAGAHLVLHVRVTDQHTVEGERRPSDRFGDLSTINEVQVLQSFKRRAGAPVPGSIVAIRQGGGRIDRGDYVDLHSFNKLAPLNVGDEYVLFVYIDAAGTHTIYAAEQGTFLVRNGRIVPLGSGGAASAWKGHSAPRFFEALR